MYAEFFKLNEPPFSIAPNPRYLYMSARHQEALAHLLYGIGDGGGFVLLTGEVGTGKTTICHSLLEQLPKNVDIALILNPRVNAIELLGSLCDELQIPYPDSSQSLKKMVDALNRYLLDAHARGRRTVVMIDEAQNLSFEVLEQIRLLTNLETSQTKLLQMILVGQPELNQLLETQELRQLNQRITARYHLQPLTFSETTQYMQHRIAVSGGDAELFSGPAIRKIYRYSKGIPRLINNVCDRSLLGAYGRGLKKVTSQIVKKAAGEVLPPARNQRHQRQALWIPALATMLLACAGGLYYLFGDLKLSANHEKLAMADSPMQRETSGARKEVKPANSKASSGTRSGPNPAPKSGKKKPGKENLENTESTPEKNQGADFDERLRGGKANLDSAFANLFAQWRLEDLEKLEYNCRGARQRGLYCLNRRSSWKRMIEFDRPVIMEFSLGRSKKAYATLTGLENGRPSLAFGDQRQTFPLRSVLSSWNGHHIILWKPPDPNLPLLRPGLTAGSVNWLRSQLSLPGKEPAESPETDHFDDELKMRVAQYQTEHGLKPDAIVGPLTFIQLNNEHPNPTIPRLQ